MSAVAATALAACWVTLIGLFCGCSSRESSGEGADEKGAAADTGEPGDRADTPTRPPLPMAPMGVSNLRAFAYSMGKGRASFSEALAVHKKRGPRDWRAIAAHCRAALSADPEHLEAHWYLGLALARQGQHAQVVGHLSTAIAGDFMRWGERSLSIKALAEFYETEPGRQFRELVARYRQKFRELVADGVLVVGRRGKPWYPDRAGNGSLNHRAEIYAYSPTDGRYVRLSRTNGSLVGFLVSPAGTELAYVSYRAVFTPLAAAPVGSTSEERPFAVGAAERRETAYIRKLTIGTIDLERAAMSARDIELAGVAELWLGYADTTRTRPGQTRLLARVRSPRSAETPSAPDTVRTYKLDVARGRARLLTVDTSGEPAGEAAESAQLRGEVLHVAYDRVELLRLPIAGVMADWDENGAAGAFRLEHTRTTVTLADGGLALGHTMTWSPSRTRLAFAQLPEASAGDCERGAFSKPIPLYVVEAATGAHRQVGAALGLQAPVWVDDSHLAYIDPGRADSAVVILDVEADSTAPPAARLTALGGVGTHYLPGQPFSLPGCDER